MEITDLFLVATGEVRDKTSVRIGHQPPEVRRVKSDLALESPNNPQVDGSHIDGENRLPALEPVSRLQRENGTRHPVKDPVCELTSYLHLNGETPTLPTHKEVKMQAMTQTFSREAHVLLAHPKSALLQEMKDPVRPAKG
jgi:hypothetical protein